MTMACQERVKHSACCSVWKESLRNAKMEQQPLLAGNLHDKRHDFIADQAFVYLGASCDVLLHATVFKLWLE